VERLWKICQTPVLIDYLIDLIDNSLGQKTIIREFHAKKPPKNVPVDIDPSLIFEVKDDV